MARRRGTKPEDSASPSLSSGAILLSQLNTIWKHGNLSKKAKDHLEKLCGHLEDLEKLNGPKIIEALDRKEALGETASTKEESWDVSELKKFTSEYRSELYSLEKRLTKNERKEYPILDALIKRHIFFDELFPAPPNAKGPTLRSRKINTQDKAGRPRGQIGYRTADEVHLKVLIERAYEKWGNECEKPKRKFFPVRELYKQISSSKPEMSLNEQDVSILRNFESLLMKKKWRESFCRRVLDDDVKEIIFGPA